MVHPQNKCACIPDLACFFSLCLQEDTTLAPRTPLFAPPTTANYPVWMASERAAILRSLPRCSYWRHQTQRHKKLVYRCVTPSCLTEQPQAALWVLGDSCSYRHFQHSPRSIKPRRSRPACRQPPPCPDLPAAVKPRRGATCCA